LCHQQIAQWCAGNPHTGSFWQSGSAPLPMLSALLATEIVFAANFDSK